MNIEGHTEEQEDVDIIAHEYHHWTLIKTANEFLQEQYSCVQVMTDTIGFTVDLLYSKKCSGLPTIRNFETRYYFYLLVLTNKNKQQLYSYASLWYASKNSLGTCKGRGNSLVCLAFHSVWQISWYGLVSVMLKILDVAYTWLVIISMLKNWK